MLVHRCDRCCVYKKEIQPCSPKYMGIWAICMNKIMFPFQRCNSVSKCSFREFRLFSVIVEHHWPYMTAREHKQNTIKQQCLKYTLSEVIFKKIFNLLTALIYLSSDSIFEETKKTRI